MGLKILTLDQKLSRLPIVLAQLKAGNKKTYKLNQETIAFFLRFKKLTKTIYNNLINAI